MNRFVQGGVPLALRAGAGAAGQVRQVSSRVPLIRFRQGGLPPHPAAAAPQSPLANPQSQAPQSVRKVTSAPIIEDWQLPTRYKRRPISEEECLAINMGGAP